MKEIIFNEREILKMIIHTASIKGSLQGMILAIKTLNWDEIKPEVIIEELSELQTQLENQTTYLKKKIDKEAIDNGEIPDA